jgi:hypothetical protein
MYRKGFLEENKNVKVTDGRDTFVKEMEEISTICLEHVIDLFWGMFQNDSEVVDG